MQRLRGEQEGWEEIEEIKLFFNSIKSKETRAKYRSYFKKYLELTGIDINSLASEKDPRIIAMQIIDFISNQKSKEITDEMIRKYTKIVNMGCMEKESCPTLFLHNFIDWNIEDPKGNQLKR